MKISVTSSSVESSQPSSTCRYGLYLVCTWCLTEMLSFRCWLVLLAMDLSTVGTRAFSTSSVNSQAISLIFVIIRLYSFSPSTWTNSQKIWVSLLYRAVHWFWGMLLVYGIHNQPCWTLRKIVHRMPVRTVPCYLSLTDTQFYCRREFNKTLLDLTLPGYAKTSSDIYDLILSRFRWWTLVYFTCWWFVELVVAWSRCELLRWSNRYVFYHSDRKQLWVKFPISRSFYTVTLTCLRHSKQNKRYPLSLC